MKRSTLRLFLVLGTLSIIGIIVTQVFWVKKAFDLKEKQFSHNVNLALQNTAAAIIRYNQHEPPPIIPVNQLASNYFVVAVNDHLDISLLETLLRHEFKKRNITIDFEYGLYDCMSEKMQYGNYISALSNPKQTAGTPLPVWNKNVYYFGVYFPDKDSNLFSQMGIWIYSTAVMLIVIVFFGYSMLVILKQRRLSEVQRDFINNMTHEFKTPISTIVISAGVLQKPDIVSQPVRLSNYATIIQDEATRLKNQVERVLQMAQVDREEIKLNREPVEVHEVIEHVISTLKPCTPACQAAFTLDLRAHQPQLQADKLHFTNIVYNLLDNAIKYSGPQPNITVTTQNTTLGLQLSIRDQGVGIKPDEQKKIFQKFYRVPTGNVHDVKGFGLGLSYVQNLVKAHQGTIQVQSQWQKGSTFTIFIPYN